MGHADADGLYAMYLDASANREQALAPHSRRQVVRWHHRQLRDAHASSTVSALDLAQRSASARKDPHARASQPLGLVTYKNVLSSEGAYSHVTSELDPICRSDNEERNTGVARSSRCDGAVSASLHLTLCFSAASRDPGASAAAVLFSFTTNGERSFTGKSWLGTGAALGSGSSALR
ncbi:hypothetical protein EI94DRAFT_1800522 [Lactarius quietus]|nr:hypothetical protein EI94DRAFT_1800522 [Lactarius quietus]